MPKLKAEFRKPKLTLYNTNYVALGVLTNRTHLSAHNIVLTKTVNDTPSITFDIPMGGLIDGSSTELLVKYKHDYFVIKEISMSDGDTGIISVVAEHIVCELKGIIVGYFDDLIGETPQSMWDTVVENTSMVGTIKNKYIFETNIVDTYRHLVSDEEKSIFEYLLTIAERFDSCLLFSTDADGKIHINLHHGDIDRNKYVRKGRDLKQLDLTFNTESLFTKMTPFGGTDEDGVEVNIIDVNHGKSYITNYDYYLSKGMTQAQIDSSPLCNQECVFRDEEILDAEELLRIAEEELKRLSEPVVDGNVSIIDLNVFEGSLYLSPILCEKIVVIDKDLGYSISCKITSIAYNFENPLESQVGISNVIKYHSSLKDLVQNAQTIDRVITKGIGGSPTLNASKVHGIIDGHIAQLKYSMEGNITDITDAVILFEDRIEGDEMFGALAIGSRGILISRELDASTNQWVWTTAIDATGLSTSVVNAIEINASQIKGDVIKSYDEKTWIDLDTGEFNFRDRIKFIDNAFTISLDGNKPLEDYMDELTENYRGDLERIEQDVNDVVDRLDNIQGEIGEAFRDGIITEAERLMLENSITELEKEKIDIDKRYVYISNNRKLSGDMKDILSEAYKDYNTIHTMLIESIRTAIEDGEATQIDRDEIDRNLADYAIALGTLSRVFDEAINDIANNMITDETNSMYETLHGEILDVSDRLDEVIDDVGGVIADGIIDEAEAKIIENVIYQLEREKIDLDTIYEQLMNEDDDKLLYAQKQGLRAVYNVYDTAHTNFVDCINRIVEDKKVDDIEKAEFESLHEEYADALADFKAKANECMGYISQNYTDVQFNILDEKIEARVTEERATELFQGYYQTQIQIDSEGIKTSVMETVSGDLSEMQTQLDGKIETYSQATDPSKNWTTETAKKLHEGDIWYDTVNGNTHRWNGSKWVKLSDSDAQLAKELAQTKAKVFTSKPTPPYNIGDLWVQGEDGEIMRCIKDRTSGNHVDSDWQKASKYTDDSLAEALGLEVETVKTTVADIKQEADKIALSVGSTSIRVGSFRYVRDWLKGSSVNASNLWVELKIMVGNVNIAKGKVPTSNASIQTAYPLANYTDDNIDINKYTSSVVNGDWQYLQVDLGSIRQDVDSIGVWHYYKDGRSFNHKLEVSRNGKDWFVVYDSDKMGSYKETSLGRLYMLNEASYEARLKTAELKITDESIIGTVSDTIQSAIDSIEVGARNYILQSDFAENINKWYSNKATLTKEWGSDLNRYYLFVKPTDVNGGNCGAFQTIKANHPTLEKGEYTFSVYLKCSAGGGSRIGFEGATTKDVIATNTWKRYSVTMPESDYNKWNKTIIIYTLAGTSVLGMTMPKLEKGGKVSDWSLAPEDMDDKLTNYTTSSTLEQTATSITATFTSSGGYNLVKNGELKNGNKFWYGHEYQLVGSDLSRWWKVQNNEWTGYEPALELRIPNMTSGEYGVCQTIETVVGRQYVLTCYLAGHRGNYYAVVRGTESGGSWGWLESQSCGHIHGGSNPNDWHQVVIPFVAQTTETIIDFHITSTTSGNNNTYMWVKRVMVCEGTVWSPFVPHSSEIYEGITKIDQDGIEVSHSNANTKSKMSADGFSIIDENGDTIAWLTSKNTWTEIKADNVYAKNIDNIYMGDANLFVDHSKTVAGDGSSDSPFNNFKALTDYLQSTPILKKDLTINVVSTDNVSDHFDLRGIRGDGTIRINLAKTLVLNDTGANSAFYFYGCDVPITLNGGRTGYDSTDGALLNTFNYGVFFNQCKYGCVEYLAIDTSGAGNEQWGVIFRGTNGMTRRVDFMGSWNAVLADYGSNVSDHDSCGNCKNAFYAQSGANIVLGSTIDNGYKPHGQYVRNVGCVTDLGNRTATASKRSTTSLPPTSAKWQSFSYSDYGYFTPGTDDGTNRNSWNPNGKKVYQGSWGYGNNRGIFTLPNSSIDAFLSGATVLDGSTITLKRATDNGWNSPQWIQLCGTTHTKIGTGTPPVTKIYAWLGELDTGEEKTFTLPKAFVQDLKSGVIKSVMFYTSDGDYYVRFDPVCTLNIKVNK